MVKVSAISKSLATSLLFLVRDIFSKLLDLPEKENFMVFQNFLLSSMFLHLRVM